MGSKPGSVSTFCPEDCVDTSSDISICEVVRRGVAVSEGKMQGFCGCQQRKRGSCSSAEEEGELLLSTPERDRKRAPSRGYGSPRGSTVRSADRIFMPLLMMLLVVVDIGK